MNRKLKSLLLAALAAGGFAVAPASAQNTAHGPGDLILTIQNPGGATNNTNIFIADLGLTNTAFRDAAPGFHLLGVNLASTLLNFGANWFDLSTIYLGAVDFRGNAEFGNNLLTLDPNRTLYLTKQRTGVGTVGLANSNLDPVPSASANGYVSNMTTVVNQFEALNGSFPIGSFTTSTSNVDETNAVIGGIQQPAYGVTAGGVQGDFAAGSFGILGGAGTIELALDLYRVQFRNDITAAVSTTTDQYGLGAPIQTGQYLGTITVAQNGDVGFLTATAAPEPSSMALLGLTGLAAFAARRRRSAPANA